MSRARAERSWAPKQVNSEIGRYWQESESPYASLIFLLPLLILYEWGTYWMSAGEQRRPGQEIIAFLLIKQFFSFLGANGQHLPALAVVFILLAQHILRKDAWRLRPGTIVMMGAEGACLGIPLLLLGMVMPRYFPLLAVSSRQVDSIVLSLGAGVYEEMVFRLVLITLLSLILRDAFRIHRLASALLMVFTSGLLFSLYHYLSPQEPFRLQTCVFRTLAGSYFGIVFLVRGFGVTCAAHSAYDISIIMLMGRGL